MADPAAIARGIGLYQQAKQLLAAGDTARAATAFAQASAALPHHPELLLDYARLAEQTAQWPLVEKLLRALLRLRPEAPVHGVLGLSLVRQGKHADALPFLLQHARTQPPDAGNWLSVGQLQLALEQFPEALDSAARAHAVRPGTRSLGLMMTAAYRTNRADLLDRLVPEALADTAATTEMRAICGLHLLKRGRLAEGFLHATAIREFFDRPHPDDAAIAANPWDGKPFPGVLLLSAEQGLGEEIVAASVLSLLDRIGQEAVIECDPRLVPVFSRAFPARAFRPRWQGALDSLEQTLPCTRRAKVLDLARHAGTGIEDLRGGTWLLPDIDRVRALRASYRARWPGKRLVGLSWRSSRAHGGEHWKSVELTALAALLQAPDTRFVNVQYDCDPADLEACVATGLPAPVTDPDIDPREDLDGLLAQLCALDALVTVSNSTAHLAGAAGVKTHVILPQRPPVFWYWGYEGPACHWYPAITLWRPGAPADVPVIARAIREALSEIEP